MSLDLRIATVHELRKIRIAIFVAAGGLGWIITLAALSVGSAAVGASGAIMPLLPAAILSLILLAAAAYPNRHIPADETEPEEPSE